MNTLRTNRRKSTTLNGVSVEPPIRSTKSLTSLPRVPVFAFSRGPRTKDRKEASVVRLAFSFSVRSIRHGRLLFSFFSFVFIISWFAPKKKQKYWKQKDMGPLSCTNMLKYIFRLWIDCKCESLIWIGVYILMGTACYLHSHYCRLTFLLKIGTYHVCTATVQLFKCISL